MQGAGSLLGRFRRVSPLVPDSAVAVAVAAIPLYELSTELDCPCVSTTDAWWITLLILSMTLPLALRRVYPFTVVSMVGISAGLFEILDFAPDPWTRVFSLMVAVYTVAAYGRRELAIAAGVIYFVVVAALNLPELGESDFKEVVDDFVLLGGAWVVGDNIRHRRGEAKLLRDRAEGAEREREERTRIAVLEERGRIARELHDVVAHSVGVIAIQAGAGRTIAEERPDRAREAFASIEQVSRDTMAELRRALGVLRSLDEDVDMTPQPGLDRLGDLVDQFRRAGLSVKVTQEGSRPALPSGLDLSAYRIVQEALTNTLKHAGATSARVDIRYGPGAMEVTVTDEGGRTARFGTNASGITGLSGGQGVIGMRERVAMFGGTLEAGAANTGFKVRARFPLAAKGENP